MKPLNIVIIVLCLFLCNQAFADAAKNKEKLERAKKKSDSVLVLTFNGWKISKLIIAATNGFILNSEKQTQEIELTAKDDKVYLNDTLPLPECKISCDIYSFIVLKKDTSIKRYIRGIVEISASQSNLVIVSKVPIKDYLAFALAGETENSDPLEYMIGLSVLQRNYLQKAKQGNPPRHLNALVCDNTHCQKAFGTKANSKHYTAVSRAMRIELTANEPPCYYSANCGGGTLTPDQVWRETNQQRSNSFGNTTFGNTTTADDTNKTMTGKPNIIDNLKGNDSTINSYLKAYSNVSCNYCTKGKYYRWKREIKSSPEVDEMLQIAKECPFIDDDFKIRFGREFGFNTILSNTVDKIERKNNKFIIYGKGFGHRVGMCQEGAMALALQGVDAASILRFYFPYARIITQMK